MPICFRIFYSNKLAFIFIWVFRCAYGHLRESVHNSSFQFVCFHQVTYLGKVTISGTHFLSGCTESAVMGLCDTKRTSVTHDDSITSSSAILEIRPFQVRLHHQDGRGEATVAMDTFQVARIAYCTADHDTSPNVFAWIYRQINDDLTFQMDCHAVECENKLEAKKLAHSMMEAFKKTFHSMRSDGRIHKSGSSDEFPEELSTPDDGWEKA